MNPTVIIYHLIAIACITAAAYTLYRAGESLSVVKIMSSGLLMFLGLAFIALAFPVAGFARIQLLAWEIFFYFPLTLSLGALFFWKAKRTLALGLGFLALSATLVAVDSLLIEPFWLQTTRIEISSAKISDPLTLVLLADIQTDQPGDYEEKVLHLVGELNPDLILLAGDYIQVQDLDLYTRETENLNQIFNESNLEADLGIYAVRGNVDRESWGEIFQGLNVQRVEKTERIDLGPVMFTALDWQDSANPSLQVAGSEKFHIILGHSPNFSLGEIEGDLLLAGHTHGGQVQLPGIGPLLTLSSVPRRWASGLTEIQPGKFLVVSNGIGLERGGAPRMRFLCRPEIILIHLQPVP